MSSDPAIRHHQPDPRTIAQLAAAVQTTAEAANRIAEVAARQAEIIEEQRREIAALRERIADEIAATARATEAAGFWYKRATELAQASRRDLPARLARNLATFANPN